MSLANELVAKIIAIGAACLLLTASASATSDGRITGWITEPGVDPPSYAVTEPTESDLNVDTVLLLCTESRRDRLLELDLYLSTEGPLIPQGADPQALKETPRVEIVIDGEIFAAELLFSDDHVVLVDSRQDMSPSLSGSLLDAMERGETMVLRFDLLAEPPGLAPTFDSQVVLDLGAGRSAIAAIRTCAPSNLLHQAIGNDNLF